MNPVQRIHNGLVVSCQAWPDSPLHGPVYMAAMARAAEKGGAAGIRANGVDDIAAIAAAITRRLPIIGIQKSHDAAGQLWITATFEEAAAVARAWADIVAVDSRREERPDGTRLGDLFTDLPAKGMHAGWIAVLVPKIRHHFFDHFFGHACRGIVVHINYILHRNRSR